MGALTFPTFTSSLNASPAFSRSPCPNQHIRAGNPWKAIFSLANLNHRCNDWFCGNNLDITSSVTAISFGSPLNAAHRNGPLPSQKSGRMYAGTKPGKSNGERDFGFLTIDFFVRTHVLLPLYYFHNQT